MPKEGDKAPDFDLPDQDGNRHKLADYMGKWVVLFAYPKASTGG
jgi:peroxiredoxin Q/BCP